MYREQEFVERCFCDQPATQPCRCCGRARCELHLQRDLCNRCTQFVEREVSRSAGRAWWLGGVCGVVTTFGLLVAGMTASVLVGLPVAVAVGLAYARIKRARAIRALGPQLSASRGELPPAPREPDDLRDTSFGSPHNRPPYV